MAPTTTWSTSNYPAVNNKKRKARRSRIKKPKNIKMYYCNMNGLKSKLESTKQIVERLDPKVIIMCETKLPSDTVLKTLLPTYEINSRSMKTGQGGLAIAVKIQTFNSVNNVTSTPHKNILVTRIGLDDQAIRIILGYAPQETEAVETREHFFTELEIELSECKLAGDVPVLIGDMNAKLDEREDKSLHGTTSNGKLLMELVESQELKVLNFERKCSGKWTHVIRTTGASSVLDYVSVTSELLKNLKDMIIDEDFL